MHKSRKDKAIMVDVNVRKTTCLTDIQGIAPGTEVLIVHSDIKRKQQYTVHGTVESPASWDEGDLFMYLKRHVRIPLAFDLTTPVQQYQAMQFIQKYYGTNARRNHITCVQISMPQEMPSSYEGPMMNIFLEGLNVFSIEPAEPYRKAGNS